MGGAMFLIVLVCILIINNAKSGEGLGTFGFDVHHRYSDTVKDFMNLDGLPEKGTMDYYAAMAHRDHLFKARRLATSPATSPTLTFFGGNQTYRVNSLGFLHYSIVRVGTPSLRFLVALDTGSNLFWLPCECTNCAKTWNPGSGQPVDLNIYSPNASTTSAPIPCNSTKCGVRRGCLRSRDACAYQEVYLSANTSSTGILVDDVLHLGTNEDPQKPVDVPITLGCGVIQTGDFVDTSAINGLFGLGMDNVSVPSLLASQGLAPNSFSMCFSPDGLGRIEFGDKGSSNQSVTPFNLYGSNPTYNVTVAQTLVGKNVSSLEFAAVFDSGTSFTYLNDPVYTFITKSFDSQISEQRYQPPTRIIFDYCYALGTNQNNYTIPDLNLTMKGGDLFSVVAPTIIIPRRGGFAYCLAIVKSEDINLFGQNFMTGYRLVFDREEMVLGWKEANCDGSTLSSTNGSNSSASAPPPEVTTPPPPEVTTPPPPPRNRTRSPPSVPPPAPSPPSLNPLSGNNAARLSSISNKFLMLVFSILFIQISSSFF